MLTKLKKKLKSDKHLSDLIRDTGLSLFLRVFGMGSGYLFLWLIAFFWDSSVVGVFSLVLSLFSLITVLSIMGMDTSAIRFVTEHRTLGKTETIPGLFVTFSRIALYGSLLLTTIIFFCSPLIAQYIFRKEYLDLPIKIISLAILPLTFLSVTAAAIRGLNGIRESVFLTEVSKFFLASLFLLLAVLFFRDSNVPIIVFVLSTYVTAGLSLFFFIRRSGFKFSEIFSYEEEIKSKDILKVSTPMLWSRAMMRIRGSLETLILGAFYSTSEVGVYTVVIKFSALTGIILSSFNYASVTKFAEFKTKNDLKGLSKIVRQETKMIFWTTIPILSIFFLFPQLILGTFGNEYKVGAVALLILVFGEFISSISGSVGYFLQMTGKEIIARNILTISMIINLCLDLILIPKWGITGAALSCMLSTVFWKLACVFYIWKNFGIMTLYLPLEIFKFRKKNNN